MVSASWRTICPCWEGASSVEHATQRSNDRQMSLPLKYIFTTILTKELRRYFKNFFFIFRPTQNLGTRGQNPANNVQCFASGALESEALAGGEVVARQLGGSVLSVIALDACCDILVAAQDSAIIGSRLVAAAVLLRVETYK